MVRLPCLFWPSTLADAEEARMRREPALDKSGQIGE
jgi:hypothetical protein